MRALARRLKRIIKAALGQDFFPRLDSRMATERLGSDYGGWEVVSAAIRPDAVVYSFGVGEDASFDLALMERFGVTVHAFDPTPRSIAWVRDQGFPPGFVMHPYGVAEVDGDLAFHPPENPAHVSHTLLDRAATQDRSIRVPVKRLETIMNELGHTHIDVLKMDIEGAEYAVLTDMERTGIRPTQLLVEFHHRFPTVGLKQTKAALQRLRSLGYALFSVSSKGEEFCFIRTPEA